MKKIALLLSSLVCIICCALGLAACDDNVGGGDNKKVDYVNLGARVISIDVNEEQAVAVNVIPTSAKYELTCSASPEGIVEVKKGTTVQGEKGGESETEAIIVKGLAHGSATVTVTAGEVSATFDVVVETVTKGLEYDIYGFSDSDEQIAWCKGLGTATETDIVVASVYHGIPVRRVAFFDDADCARVTGITLPDTVREFTPINCTALTNVVIPDTATNLERVSFYNCTALGSITIPNCSPEAEILFTGCTSLSEVTLPSNLERITYSAFEGCTSLEEITLPSALKKIENSAFMNCTSLEKIILPDIEKIEFNAFKGCTSFTTIVIPNSVTSIGSGAFADCTNLESVYLGKGLNEIGNNAFYECNNITTLEVWGFQFVGNSSSAQIADLFNLRSEYSSLRKITVASGVTVLVEGAFSDCTYLTELELPSTLTAIQNNATGGCRNLTTVRYNGTVGRWQNIAGYWMPDYTSDLIIYCTDGTIAHGMIYNETA